MKVINLFGPPGTGKSTSAALIFSKLKAAGVNAEMSREYAKEIVWGKKTSTLRDQIYIFGKQHHRLFILQDDVDVAVTDCPLPLSILYGKGKYPESFIQTVLWAFNQYDNTNVLLTRQKAYNPKGRLQSESESDALGLEIVTLLNKYNIPYQTVPATDQGIADFCKAQFGI